MNIDNIFQLVKNNIGDEVLNVSNQTDEEIAKSIENILRKNAVAGSSGSGLQGWLNCNFISKFYS